MPPKPAAQRTVYNGTTVEVMFGDMTTFQSDAIVNAANVNLRGGAGIDGAIHAAAGPGLLAELIARFPGIPAGVVGGAYTTGAHNIQTARHIIHTVGPNYNGVGNDIAAQGLAHQQLHNAYRNSLQEAVNNGDRSIAFPTISTGIYAFPRQEAAFLALRAVRDFLDGAGRGRLDRVVFLIYGEEDLHAYNARFS
jgi:O-acetyl-ADP-ribose deacetylase (regulator of RNase III)